MPIPGMNTNPGTMGNIANSVPAQAANLKKRLDKEANSVTRKKDSGSMLANANYKNALIHGASGNTGVNQNNAGGKGGSGANNAHGRTKSQNAAGSVNLKLGAM